MESKQESNRAIGKVRELLYGRIQRENKEQVQSMENRLADLENLLETRVGEIEKRMELLVEETESYQRSSIAALGKAIAELGTKVMKSV